MNYLGSKTLETPRLLLRKTEEQDLKELWEILLLEEVSKYYLTTKINSDWEKEKHFQYKKLEESSNDNIFRWTIEKKDTKEVIGQISVQEKGEQDDIRDVGWFIDPMHHRKGYGYEAAMEVLKYMFLEVEITSIITCAAIKNPSSWKLMEKLGFKKLPTTHKVKYTLLDDEEEVYEYELTKKDFLKEYFRKEKLYITEDIDKDPYIKHLTDDRILNLTGESGSGKTTATEAYKDNPDCIIIDTDILFSKKEIEMDSIHKELRETIKKKYNELPDLCKNFDNLYQDILEFFKESDKMIIIDSAQFRNLKDISLLKGDIIIIRTCINTCYNRCINRYKEKNPNASFEELSEYSTRKKNMYKWYHSLNDFIDRIDKKD